MTAWRGILFSAGSAIALLPSISATAAQPVEKNSAIRPMLDCRKIGEPTERLACFDRTSAVLDSANEKNELTVLDKEAVRKTRRSLFGLSLPQLSFLGGGNDESEKEKAQGFDSIQATITSARDLGYGNWQIRLDDGAQWVTSEPINGRTPAPGKSIEIKRGAVGSYLGKIDGGRAVRMRRTN